MIYNQLSPFLLRVSRDWTHSNMCEYAHTKMERASKCIWVPENYPNKRFPNDEEHLTITVGVTS